MDAIVLDTSVLIDVLRGRAEATEYVRSLGKVPSCSELSRAEVLRGLRDEERQYAEDLFAELRWIPVDETIARRAGELGRRWDRSHPGIGTSDLVIAATAMTLGASIATSNVKHYPMFPGLRAPYPT